MRIKIFQAVMPEFARSEVGAFASFFNGSHSRTFLVASRSSLSQDDPLCLPADAQVIIVIIVIISLISHFVLLGLFLL